MNEQSYTYRAMRWALYGGILLFFLLVLAWIMEGQGKEWRRIQKEYETLLVERSGDPAAGREVEKGIFQVQLPQFHRNDRCISCHFGLEDERMAGLPAPVQRTKVVVRFQVNPTDQAKPGPLGEHGARVPQEPAQSLGSVKGMVQEDSPGTEASVCSNNGLLQRTARENR